MGALLDRARAVTPRPTTHLTLAEFAHSGRLLRVRIPDLEAPGIETLIVLAADNADTDSIPPDVVIFWPDEVAAMLQARRFDPLLWETKRWFDPHGRTQPEEYPAA